MNTFVKIVIGTLWFFVQLIVGVIKSIVPILRKSVKNEVVLITGAGSGLGRLMSVEFAKRGSTLVLWDINRDGNEETADLVRRHNVSAYTYVCDLSKREAIYKSAEQVKKDVGEVNILVNNAGIVTGKKFLKCPDSWIEKTMDVNVNAHFWTTKCFLPAMMERNHGHIVCIASSAGLFGVASLADYCASKFAAVGFHESLSTELSALKKTGVKTTVVCPFFINTGMFDGIKTSPLLPMLEPEYVVSKIMTAVETNQAYLLLPRSMYFFYFLKGFLPATCLEPVNSMFDMHKTMNTFVGRSKQQ